MTKTSRQNITKLPSGNYRWRVWVTFPNGKKKRRSGTAATVKEAHQQMHNAIEKARKGRKPMDGSLTIDSMVADYMDSKSDSWATRTFDNNQDFYNRHVKPRIGDQKAAALEPETFNAFFKELSEAQLGYSYQRQIHVLLSGAFKRAVGRGLLDSNPLQYARPKRPRGTGPASLKAFTLDEAALFFKVASEDRWGQILAFMLVTGLRLGEAVALRTADVKRDKEGQVCVQISKTRSEFKGKPYENQPKTAAGIRRVYLSLDAQRVLERMAEYARHEASERGDAVSEYLFPSSTGLALRHDTVRHVMARLCEAAGVPLRSPHKLRHTFASLVHQQGDIDIAQLSAHLGHADKSVTLNFYRSVYEEERQEVVLNLSQEETGEGKKLEQPQRRSRRPKRVPKAREAKPDLVEEEDSPPRDQRGTQKKAS